MDLVTDLLDGARARGAFLLETVVDPPWSFQIEDRAPLTVLVVVRGTAWVVRESAPGTEERVRLDAGTVALVRGPEPYRVADPPDTAPQVRIEEGQDCKVLDASATPPAALGMRQWGTNPLGATSLLVGTYPRPGEVSGRLLRALPALLVIEPARAPGADRPDDLLLRLLRAEMGRAEPGQEAVLDRLLDLIVASVLRSWLQDPGRGAPPWLSAHGDAVVSAAVGRLHANLRRAWTVASLAAECGVSRATLAQRFTATVGEPPMAFLRGLRLALAADLLRDPGSTIEAVAYRVGYGSPFALSTAFKRLHGVSPAAYRHKAPPVPIAPTD